MCTVSHGNNLSQHFGIQADQSIMMLTWNQSYNYWAQVRLLHVLNRIQAWYKGPFPGLDIKSWSSRTSSHDVSSRGKVLGKALPNRIKVVSRCFPKVEQKTCSSNPTGGFQGHRGLPRSSPKQAQTNSIILESGKILRTVSAFTSMYQLEHCLLKL